ncbi:MAG: cobalamin-dependent protein [Deltaproteobacteria bacterium]|nr:cobalamin-dependent protein [Deltaproteobacteria bacterium]
MKITLIWPPSPFLIDQRAFPPLGVLYLAAYLEANGVQVEVADMTDREDDLEAALIPHTGADLYGVSSSTPQYPQSLRILDIIRRHDPEATTVIGGPHASSLPEKCLRDGFDFVVAGEGERAFLDLIHRIEKGSVREKVISAPSIRDLDSIPFPARHLIDLTSYAYDIDGGKGTTLFTSRGCPYACAFCSKDVWPKGVRFNSSGYVMNELRHIMDVYGFRHFLFLDDSLTLHTKRVFELCRQIEPLGIKWRCYARTSTTKETLQAMKSAGCVEVGVGVESGSQKILDMVNKGETVEENTHFVEMCKDIGLTANVFIMIGLPGETYETVEETRRWMDRVRPQKFGFNMFMPYAGTPIYNHPEKYDIRIYDVPDDKSWIKGRQGEYNVFVSTGELSREDILRLFTEHFKYYNELTGWRPGVGKN